MTHNYETDTDNFAYIIDAPMRDVLTKMEAAEKELESMEAEWYRSKEQINAKIADIKIQLERMVVESDRMRWMMFYWTIVLISVWIGIWIVVWTGWFCTRN